MGENLRKRSRDEETGKAPVGKSMSPEPGIATRDADSIIQLLQARLDLPDLSNAAMSRAVGVARNQAPAQARASSSIAPLSPLEMTPTPMVVAASVGADGADTRTVEPSAQREASAVDISAGQRPPNGDELDVGDVFDPDAWTNQAEYQPPRKPPTSVAPPAIATSISVAAEYDPKAPTRPRVRRNSSAPPGPMLFGLDRMLVWGLVLGGLFVAAIVVIVHKIAPISELTRNRQVQLLGVDRRDEEQELRDRSPDSGSVPTASSTSHQPSTKSEAVDAGTAGPPIPSRERTVRRKSAMTRNSAEPGPKQLPRVPAAAPSSREIWILNGDQ